MVTNRLLITAVVAMVSGAANATTWYVDGAHGHDTAPGTTPATAFATPGKALSVVQAGDTIDLLPTTDYGPLSITNLNGAAGRPITIRGERGRDGRWTHVVGGGSDLVNAVAVTSSTNITVAWLDITHVLPVFGVGIAKSAHVTIYGNSIHDSPGGGIGAYGADYLYIARNSLTGNGQPYRGLVDGSLLDGNGQIVIENLTSVDNVSDVNKILISANVIYGDPSPQWTGLTLPLPNTEGRLIGMISPGIYILNTFPQPYKPYIGRIGIVGNLMFDNTGEAIKVLGFDNVTILHNTIFDNGHDPYFFVQYEQYKHATYRGDIVLGGSRNDSIFSNIIKHEEQRDFIGAPYVAYPIYAEYADLLRVEGNVIDTYDYGDTDQGVYTVDTPRAEIKNNVNAPPGLVAEPSSAHGIVTANLSLRPDSPAYQFGYQCPWEADLDTFDYFGTPYPKPTSAGGVQSVDNPAATLRLVAPVGPQS